MAIGALPERVTYRDAKGNTARVSFFVANTGTLTSQSAAASAVITAMDPLTNAARQSNTGPATEGAQEVVYGTNANYGSVEDKAVFVFQSATGAIHRFQIPAPVAAIFLPDGETIDPGNALVGAFATAVTANATSRAGDPITFGSGLGTRIRRKMHRRLTIFVKDPSLNEPAE